MIHFEVDEFERERLRDSEFRMFELWTGHIGNYVRMELMWDTQEDVWKVRAQDSRFRSVWTDLRS